MYYLTVGGRSFFGVGSHSNMIKQNAFQRGSASSLPTFESHKPEKNEKHLTFFLSKKVRLKPTNFLTFLFLIQNLNNFRMILSLDHPRKKRHSRKLRSILQTCKVNQLIRDKQKL